MFDDEDDGLADSVRDPTDAIAVDIPEAPTPGDDLDATDIPRDLVAAFWSIVVALNLAVLAVCLGPLLAVVNGQVRLGLGLFGLGLLGFAYAYYRYRRYRRNETEPADSTQRE